MKKVDVIVSRLTTYDEDELLYYTKVGLNNPDRNLLFIAVGDSVKQSKSMANRLAKLYQSQFLTPKTLVKDL